MSASAPGSPIAGRVVITARAIETVFSALAAEELGGTARGTRVRVLERVESARQRILTTGTELTGATLTDVTIRVTDITSESEKRAQ